MNEITKNESPEVKTRTKSRETVLKLQMRTIQRDLIAVDKTVAQFNELKKAAEGADAKREKLTARLGIVKADLVKELGLD